MSPVSILFNYIRSLQFFSLKSQHNYGTACLIFVDIIHYGLPFSYMPSAIFLSASPILDPHSSPGARSFKFDGFLNGSQGNKVGLGDTIQVSVHPSSSVGHYPSSVSLQQPPYTFYCTVRCIHGYSTTHVAFSLQRMSTKFPQTLYVPHKFSRLSICQRALGSLITLPRRCRGSHKAITCNVKPALYTGKNAKAAERKIK